jgi:large-conductance mechanosensitive channel
MKWSIIFKLLIVAAAVKLIGFASRFWFGEGSMLEVITNWVGIAVNIMVVVVGIYAIVGSRRGGKDKREQVNNPQNDNQLLEERQTLADWVLKPIIANYRDRDKVAEIIANAGHQNIILCEKLHFDWRDYECETDDNRKRIRYGNFIMDTEGALQVFREKQNFGVYRKMFLGNRVTRVPIIVFIVSLGLSFAANVLSICVAMPLSFYWVKLVLLAVEVASGYPCFAEAEPLYLSKRKRKENDKS